MKKTGFIVLLGLGILPCGEPPAQQTASGVFRVSASVLAACDVAAADFEFGTHTRQSGSRLLGTTQMQAMCTPGASFQVGLNVLGSPGATIYLSSPRSAVWGNTPGMNTVTGVGTGETEAHTLFGSVPASRLIPDGDTVSVRVYF